MSVDLLSFNDVVIQFDEIFGKPSDLATLIKLRMNLIYEEYGEFVAEMVRDPSNFDSDPNPNFDKAKAGKELADILFVVLGAFDTLEIPLEEALTHVAHKNWAKAQNKDKMQIRPDGKVLKPAGDERFT